jgi:hypothetical protein
MINGDLASSILYTVSGGLFAAAVVFAIVALTAIRSPRGRIVPQEQMRERVPWPPPPPEPVWHRKDEPLALPRGER